MRLRALVVIDPVGNVAELISTQCRRLAQHRVVATSGSQALNLVLEWHPEVILLSLEIDRPPATALLPQLCQAVPKSLIIATYRQLSAAQMTAFRDLGVHTFLAHPLAATALYREVSQRFQLPFRQFQRFGVDLEIADPQGNIVGRTLDLSSGGMRFVSNPQALPHPPLQPNTTLALSLHLPSTPEPTPFNLTCHILAVEPRAGTIIARCQFAELPPPAQQHLQDFLNHHALKLDSATY